MKKVKQNFKADYAQKVKQNINQINRIGENQLQKVVPPTEFESVLAA